MATGKKFAVFDIDGTLIRWQLYHALADSLAQSGHVKPETYQTMRDARQAWKRRSGSTFRDYEKAVIAIYESVLKTLSFEQLDEAITAVFEEYKDQTYTYTRELLRSLKKRGYLLFAISGSQTEIVAKIAGYYGFDDYVGTVYERRQAGFSGSVTTIGSFHKDKSLRDLVKKHDAGSVGSVGVGDSASDIKMLKLVKQPIAFNPEQALFDHARINGWKIVIERKNMIYELEKRGKAYELAKTNAG
jgi:HAD superfamily hydrolase (TIGR01490 family)